ncbi:hypothetical protein RJ640_016673 [Escallonia rubra]|uniref:Ty3 transposon capsid-like protein domain-containing protein n=1 Tax=Escallonia rubra TaxID=112253 RepID=A0AA88S165_9ASTE|nr:hypothetical protein RJ640_016673 [Escallonia rubra]
MAIGLAPPRRLTACHGHHQQAPQNQDQKAPATTKTERCPRSSRSKCSVPGCVSLTLQLAPAAWASEEEQLRILAVRICSSYFHNGLEITIKPLPETTRGYNTRQAHKPSQLDEHVNLMEAQFADHFGNIDEQLFVLKETVSKIPELKMAVDQMKMELPGVRHSLAELHQMLQHLINSNAGESANKRKIRESEGPESSHKECFKTTNGNLFCKLPKLKFPKFRGEDSYGWVRKAERFFGFNPVEVPNKVSFASIHFEGQAEHWFGAYIKTKERVLWPEFVKDVHSRFAKLFKESVVGEFHKLMQQTSVEAYYNEFETIRSMMVSEGCQFKEEYFTQSFISGLKEELRTEVEKFETNDLSRAIFLARKHEASM